jgi:hypothetical protein
MKYTLTFYSSFVVLRALRGTKTCHHFGGHGVIALVARVIALVAQRDRPTLLHRRTQP